MDIIRLLQSFRNPFLDACFKFITFFGDEYFYIIALTLLIWFWNKEKGFLLGISVLLTLYFNSLLKAIFAIPRPEGVALIHATSYSFPSGHAMGSFAFFITLALFKNNRRFTVFALIAVFLIGLSRVYLGVHYARDVIAGWVFSAILLLGYYFLRNFFQDFIDNVQYIKIGVVASLIFVFLFIIHPEPFARDNLTVIGALAGFFSGGVLERRMGKYQPPTSLLRKSLFGMVGILCIAAIYSFFSYVIPQLNIFRFIKYFCLSIFVSYIAPYIFQRIDGKKV